MLATIVFIRPANEWRPTLEETYAELATPDTNKQSKQMHQAPISFAIANNVLLPLEDTNISLGGTSSTTITINTAKNSKTATTTNNN